MVDKIFNLVSVKPKNYLDHFMLETIITKIVRNSIGSISFASPEDYLHFMDLIFMNRSESTHHSFC